MHRVRMLKNPQVHPDGSILWRLPERLALFAESWDLHKEFHWKLSKALTELLHLLHFRYRIRYFCPELIDKSD